jgi:hypothetical protein
MSESGKTMRHWAECLPHQLGKLLIHTVAQAASLA